MLYLKQSTASQSILLGAFVDSTDGATAETALTIANTDIRLSKNGGNMAAKNLGGGTHDENGWYTITLDAIDTDTVGRLQISCKVAGALAVWMECQVLEENIYNALFGVSAVGFDSNQRVDVGSVGGTAQTANDNGADINSILADTNAILVDTGTTLDNHLTDIKGTGFVKDTHSLVDIEAYVDLIDDATNGLANIKTLIDTVDTVVDGIQTDLSNGVDGLGALKTLIDTVDTVVDAIKLITDALPNSGALTDIDTGINNLETRVPDTISLTAINAEVDSALDTAIPASPTSGSINDVLDIQKDAVVSGLAQTGTLSTTQMTTDLSETTNDHYKGRVVVFRGGVLDGQATDITSYSGTNGLITMTAITEAPVNNQAFTIV